MARCGSSTSLIPRLREERQRRGCRPTTIGAPLEQLDLATVVKVSQAVSGEIVLERLIDTLMRIALEQAGAERGLLVLRAGRARCDRGGGQDRRDAAIVVTLRQAPVTPSALPEVVLHSDPDAGQRHPG